MEQFNSGVAEEPFEGFNRNLAANVGETPIAGANLSIPAHNSLKPLFTSICRLWQFDLIGTIDT